MISTATTVITAGSLNPENARSCGTTPARTPATSVPSAMTSKRHRSLMNSAMATTMMAMMIAWSMVIACHTRIG